MYTLTTLSGEKITGDEMPWHELPTDILVKELGLQFHLVDGGIAMTLADLVVTGFQEYGFQLYDIQPVDGSSGPVAHGAQIIGIDEDADTYTVFDFNMTTGATRVQASLPLAALTYRKDLLRRGC